MIDLPSFFLGMTVAFFVSAVLTYISEWGRNEDEC